MKSEETDTYHIYNRGNNGAPILNRRSDKRAFLNLVRECMHKYNFVVHHYTLMTNHYHLLLGQVDDKLAKIMKFIDHKYSLYYKRKYGHKGRLWQHRYGRKPIDSFEYLLYCGAYIELNSVRAGMVRHPEEYEWSSYRYYAFGEPNDFLTPLPEFNALANGEPECREVYREFVQSWI